ncbi:MAG: hypothetical protein CO113_05130 [Elusimicrobia bacterium CG_4_9_14_3_um_filter_62_55]|nr:MAG: hypothetical protein COX66_15150 [Elusimicrobia bacterium CG_4_10_14_0_2_um_filter_63_34]PJB26126.1 MAG: hypothetical protein CO113_05130 [Elusimicrobia bacterium CG_4_9_14_3_um_filter_62_55]
MEWNKTMKAAAIVCVAALTAACSGTRRTVGVQTIDSASEAKAPKWVTQSVFEEDGRIHFVGLKMGRGRLSLGLREARADAEKKVVNEIASLMYNEYSEAVKGENVPEGVGEEIRDAFHRVSESVSVSGLRQSKQYWRKMEEKRDRGVRYVWDCFVALSIDREDYWDAREAALHGAAKRAREERNRDAATFLDKVIERFDKARERTLAEAGKQARVAVTGGL